MTIRELRQSALRAHRDNVRFSAWWPTIKRHVDQAEPRSREKWARLYRSLMHLVITGDPAGMFGPGDDDAITPIDDAAKPHDTITAAKIQLPLFDPGAS